MSTPYTGIIIEESLVNGHALDGMEILSSWETPEENEWDRWHLYKVKVTKDDIRRLARCIKGGTWYMHFWNDNKDIIAAFKNKIFTFNYNDKASWKDAVEYGLSLGIPRQQLDFVIE